MRGVPLWIGSLIHEDIHRMLRKTGVPYMAEVNMTPWLPEGWGGTADGFFWNPDLKAFVLLDFKTQKGSGMKYLSSGAKEAHVKQTSAYWHAARKMGLPLVKKIGVVYVPKDEAKDVDGPVLVDFEPIPVTELRNEMKHRHGRVSEYVDSLAVLHKQFGSMDVLPAEEWLTDALAPAPEREQRIYWDRQTDTYEVKLVAPWYAAYCAFGPLCDCHSIVGKTTKIGLYDIDGNYYARPGYEEIEPTVAPKS